LTVSDSQLREIVVMRALNYEIGEIANEVNVSRNTISRRLENLRNRKECNTKTVLKTIAKGKIEELDSSELAALLVNS
jgi:IS30 family transposase